MAARAIIPAVDVSFKQELERQLAQLPAARTLAERLGDADGVYLVGGTVRDLLSATAPLDLDLVVDGDTAAVAGRLGVPRRTHDRFATCEVTLDGMRCDLARARRERYPSPGALPVVEPATIEEDLWRRDFTVNALALPIGRARGATLLDVTGGLRDLRSGTLRVLHDASFIDDPTRLLRLARYASRLGLEPDRHSRALADAALTGGALATVSPTRIGAELRLALAEPDPVRAVSALTELGVARGLAPGLGLDDDDAQLARSALALLPDDGDAGALTLAAAARTLAPERLRELLDTLAFPAGRRERVVAAAVGADRLATTLAGAGSPSAIAAVAAGAPVEAVALAGALGPQRTAREWLERLRHVGLEIDGDDLLEAGITRGPAVGAGLAAARAARLDGRAPGRDAQLEVALRAAAAHGA
ncbi:MAG: hypothetical protein ACRDMJ_00080 [Solirubrobacteraceae bacterium]